MAIGSDAAGTATTGLAPEARGMTTASVRCQAPPRQPAAPHCGRARCADWSANGPAGRQPAAVRPEHAPFGSVPPLDAARPAYAALSATPGRERAHDPGPRLPACSRRHACTPRIRCAAADAPATPHRLSTSSTTVAGSCSAMRASCWTVATASACRPASDSACARPASRPQVAALARPSSSGRTSSDTATTCTAGRPS